MTATATPLRRERRLLLSVLLGLAAVGWGVVLWQAADMDTGHGMDMGAGMGSESAAMGVDLTMGMAAPLFLAMWVAMMVAMMFPASAPMIVAFARAQSRRRERGVPFVPTWLFVAPYVAVWFGFGVVGYGAAVLFEQVAGDSTWVAEHLSRIAGGFLVAAGLYQLTPLKRICLSRCRSPLAFILSYWRDGRWGAVNLGLRHGLFCVGCCWLLFVVLLPLGVMNVAAMVAVAALVFAEKTLPGGERIATAAAVVLVAWGALAMAVPEVLPTSV